MYGALISSQTRQVWLSFLLSMPSVPLVRKILADQSLACIQFVEAKLGVSCHLHQVGRTHALEQGEL